MPSLNIIYKVSRHGNASDIFHVALWAPKHLKNHGFPVDFQAKSMDSNAFPQEPLSELYLVYPAQPTPLPRVHSSRCSKCDPVRGTGNSIY